MKTKLARVFDELLREIESNPGLRARIEGHLSPQTGKAGAGGLGSRPKNKRGTPALDPYVEMKLGEESLRQKLSSLSIDQLKDIVSGFAMDASRLALKWKDQNRLMEFIVSTVRSRIEKGDAFRNNSETAA